MIELPTRLLAAFTAEPSGGNIGGVVYEDTKLNPVERQQIACDLAVSTTAFVRESTGRNFDVRFHSSRAEMNMCGHATVAAFAALKLDRRIGTGSYTQFTPAGTVEIEVTDDDQIYMIQPKPRFWDADIKKSVIAALLNIAEERIVQIASSGTALRHLFVELDDIGSLSLIRPSDHGLRALCSNNQIDTIGLWSGGSFEEGKVRYQLRDLCHGVGDPEEAASGTTNGALASLLWHSRRVLPDPSGILLAVGRQGYEMGRPSIVKTQLHVSAYEVEKVRVGGSASLRLAGKYCLSRT